MSKRPRKILPDHELKAALTMAAQHGITRSEICRTAGIDQSTLWKWANERSSPTMSARQEVLEAINSLLKQTRER